MSLHSDMYIVASILACPTCILASEIQNILLKFEESQIIKSTAGRGV